MDTYPSEWLLSFGLVGVNEHDHIHNDACLHRQQQVQPSDRPRLSLPPIEKNCTIRRNLSHFGRFVASINRLLYRFSIWNCSCVESLEKSGGHTFFALYGLFLIVNAGRVAEARRRASVGNIVAMRWSSSESSIRETVSRVTRSVWLCATPPTISRVPGRFLPQAQAQLEMRTNGI